MMRDIRIQPALNGFIVNVGCQTVVFTTVEMLITELGMYLKDPDARERFYLDNSINADKMIETVRAGDQVTARAEPGRPLPAPDFGR